MVLGGMVDLAVLDLQLDSMILIVFSNINSSLDKANRHAYLLWIFQAAFSAHFYSGVWM